ncbi:MAG: transglycosylase domain-containing protein [Patescibacteria group bacterium]|nr:transglycosylase domain-containing protein [Patescibacteria group bacterium]
MFHPRKGNWRAAEKNFLQSYAQKYSSSFNRPGQKKFRRVLWKFILKIILILIIIAGVFLAGAVAWFSRDLPKSTNLLTKDKMAAAKIYDRTGQTILYDTGGDFVRTKIKLSDIPDYAKWSTIVAEDRGFYSHGGLNFKGMLRALLVDILHGGSASQGGSSITQQFVKNALLSNEKTITRKIKEVILSWRMEQRFSKDEILEMYFNEIPYGGTAYGIEAAAHKYFNKNAKDLTLAEGAVLAALPQAPSYLSPYGPNKDKLLARKDWILDSLVSEGYISKEKAEAAKKEELKFVNISNSIIAPHFSFYIKELVTEKYGEQALTDQGLKIITTLDLDQQKKAEEAINKFYDRNVKSFNARNAALVALNPKTGEITAMVGSHDYFDEENDGAVNVAISPRQPGSSFKPIVYSAAFEAGFSPDTVLFDLLTTFKTEVGDYTPHNYNDHYFGPVSIRKALAGSLNVPAVKTIYLVGINNVLDLAERLGYTTFSDRSRFGLSLVLGGGEVKLLEHVSAFSALANDGRQFQPLAILRIENSDGDILEENKPEKNRNKEALKPQITRQVVGIMSDNSARAFVFGEKNYLTLPDRPVAAKTGTTNDFKDGWTLGFTPSLAVGVWVGNTRGDVMKGAADGSNVAAPIWHEFMVNALKGTLVENFIAPDSIILPNKPMLNGSFTAETIVGNVKKIEVHNILHYINRNNILGPAPATPWDDPNYNSWELAVQDWAQKNGYINKEVVVDGSEPIVTILKPVAGAILTKDDFPFTISFQLKNYQNINKVDAYLIDSASQTNWLTYKNISSSNNDLLWTAAPVPGKYKFYLLLTSGSQTQKSNEIDLEIK